MIEIEKTYLAKYFPDDLTKCESKEIIDVYTPNNGQHPCLRIRKNGNRFEITKKKPAKEGDASVQIEQTIPLTEEEFDSLQKVEEVKLVKTRFIYPIKNGIAEFDIFQNELAGLVLIDVEFKTEDTKNDFQMPDFCLAEVTQEKFIAGGELYGKKYSDIEENLKKYNYKRLSLS